jgi:hypothetical protein
MQPDRFLGDVGELLDGRHPAAAAVDRGRQVGGVVDHGAPCFSVPPSYNSCLRDKPGLSRRQRGENN